MGNPHASKEEIEKIIAMARLDKFIENDCQMAIPLRWANED